MKFAPEVLTEKECKALIRAARDGTPTGLRNAALITVGWRAGLRIAEALFLMPKDIDLETGRILVYGKGDKWRYVALDSEGCRLVKEWIDKREELGLTRGQKLFCSLEGRPLFQAYIRALLPRLRKKAGIEHRIHYHALRHTFASDLCREGTPLTVIRDALGHSNISTTHMYLLAISPEEVMQALRRRHWSLNGNDDDEE